MSKGCIHIYTGDGKGKTTACVGLSVRCAGAGNKVVFTQFLKDNTSSEIELLKNLPNVEFVPNDRTFGFTFLMTPEEKEDAAQYYRRHFEEAIQHAKESDAGLLVLDEIISVYNENLVDREAVCDFLRNKPQHLEVALSGREPAKELIDLADYVSEIKKIKHPFDSGIQARKGIEY